MSEKLTRPKWVKKTMTWTNERSQIDRANGKPAVITIDRQGNLLEEKYYRFGVEVTKEFAQTPPEKLDPRMILTEENTQKRMMLTQVIGYDRFINTFKHTVIDKWLPTENGIFEYELISVDESIDVESVILLKIQDQHTKVFYSLRVPPAIKTCRDAIKWVNCDIDKFEFAEEV